jgi:hypothetical protein
MDDSTSSKGGLSIQTKSSNDDDDVSFSCSCEDNSSAVDAKDKESSFLPSGNGHADQEAHMIKDVITSHDANGDYLERLDDSSFDSKLMSEQNEDDGDNENSSFSSCDDSEDETKWSLNVKLNSVVDLPSCILPSVPLCPLLKFGLLTITDQEQLQEIEQLSAAARRAEFEQSQDEKTKDLPQSSLRVKNGVLGDFQRDLSLVQCSLKLKESLSSRSSNMVISSSEKIMSKKDNGMMEWHEEMRWDEIKAPLQTVLAVELCARAVFPRSSLAQEGSTMSLSSSPMLLLSSSQMTMSDFSKNENATSISTMSASSHHRRSKTSADPVVMVGTGRGVVVAANHRNDHSVEEDEHGKNEQDLQLQSEISDISRPPGKDNVKDTKTTTVHGESGGHGILGLWRKGKQSIAERRHRRIVTTSAASPVGSNHSITTIPNVRNGIVSSDRDGGASSNHVDLNERLEIMDKTHDELAIHMATVHESTVAGKDASIDINSSTSHEVSSASDDLRLGTLLIPISNLPLEDEIPRVEKWYQFDTLGSGGDKGRFKTSPWRSPTVLLDISLCTSSTMNKLEEEMNAVPGSKNMLGNELTGNASHGEEVTEEIGVMKNLHVSKSAEHDGHKFQSEEKQVTETVQVTRKSRSNSKQQPFKKHSKGSTFITGQDRDENDEKKDEEDKLMQHGPCLEPGIIDYICVVGPKDIGKPVGDMSARGWMSSEPDCCVLEQFPPKDYHRKNGR